MALACESQDKASLVFSSFCIQTQFPKSLQSQSYKFHNVLVHSCPLSPYQTAMFKSPANSQCKLLPAQDLCISAGKFRCRKCSPISESAGSTAALTPVALECGCDTFKIEQWNQDNPSHSTWKTIHENTFENILLISSHDNHNQATKFPQIWKIGWIQSKKSCWKSFLRSQRTISLETRNSNPSHTREKCLQQQWTKDVSERRHCRQSQRNRNSPHPAADGIHRLQTSSNISCRKSVYIYNMYII